MAQKPQASAKPESEKDEVITTTDSLTPEHRDEFAAAGGGRQRDKFPSGGIVRQRAV